MTVCAHVEPRRKVRRRSRRTTWRCTIELPAEDRFRRAVAVHIAAHAVVLHDFGIPLLSLSLDLSRAAGTLDAAWQSLAYPLRDRSTEARAAAEHDCIAIHAGMIGKAFALGWEHTSSSCGCRDARLIGDLVERLEYDEMLADSWFVYQREHARRLVEEPATWTRIELLAAHLPLEPEMNGERVVALLQEFAVLDGVIVPAQSAVTPAGPVWERPGLIEVLTRSDALRSAEGEPR